MISVFLIHWRAGWRSFGTFLVLLTGPIVYRAVPEVDVPLLNSHLVSQQSQLTAWETASELSLMSYLMSSFWRWPSLLLSALSVLLVLAYRSRWSPHWRNSKRVSIQSSSLVLQTFPVAYLFLHLDALLTASSPLPSYLLILLTRRIHHCLLHLLRPRAHRGGRRLLLFHCARNSDTGHPIQYQLLFATPHSQVPKCRQWPRARLGWQ